MDPRHLPALLDAYARAHARALYALAEVERLGLEPVLSGAQLGHSPTAVLAGSRSGHGTVPEGHLRVATASAVSAHQRLAFENALRPLVDALAREVGAFLLDLRALLPVLQGPASSAQLHAFLDRAQVGRPTVRATLVLNGVTLVDRTHTDTPVAHLLERALAQGSLNALAPADQVFYPGQIFEHPFPSMGCVAAASEADARVLVRALDPAMVPPNARCTPHPSAPRAHSTSAHRTTP